jgi:diadenosine tetraphosphate (Ap4A) HIT family hydrolase
MTPSPFTQMITGERPARFVYQDDCCVALVAANPVKPGHCVLVPRQEVDSWLDAEPALLAHLLEVGQRVGRAISACFSPVKVGIFVAGIQVRHLHLHLVPIDEVAELDMRRQDPNPDPRALDQVQAQLRAALGGV